MNKIFKKCIDNIFNKTKNRKFKHWLWKRFYQDDFIAEVNELTGLSINAYTFNKLVECWFDHLSNEEVEKFYPGFSSYQEVFGKLVCKYNLLSQVVLIKEQYPLISRWMYNGLVYRVMDNEQINFNNEIASWTNTYQWLSEFFNQDYDNIKKTIIVGNTNDYYGFNFGSYAMIAMKQPKPYMFVEHEIIFPMSSQYGIAVLYGTWNEFKANVKQLNLLFRKD